MRCEVCGLPVIAGVDGGPVRRFMGMPALVGGTTIEQIRDMPVETQTYTAHTECRAHLIEKWQNEELAQEIAGYELGKPDPAVVRRYASIIRAHRAKWSMP